MSNLGTAKPSCSIVNSTIVPWRLVYAKLQVLGWCVHTARSAYMPPASRTSETPHAWVSGRLSNAKRAQSFRANRVVFSRTVSKLGEVCNVLPGILIPLYDSSALTIAAIPEDHLITLKRREPDNGLTEDPWAQRKAANMHWESANITDLLPIQYLDKLASWCRSFP